MILLLGQCGLERLAGLLRSRTGHDVVVAGWTQVELVERLKPALIYVDLYGWEHVGPLISAAITGAEVAPPETGALAAVVEALRESPAVYRGLRRPTGGVFGPTVRFPALEAALDALVSVTAAERVLDVAGLWARAGLPSDERFGFAHGEAADPEAGAHIEADAVYALWHARVRGSVKCVVVDLDDTLIHGRITDDDFASANPAYQPEGDGPRPAADAWWRLRRGLHEALRVVQQRGIVLALATRNDPAVLAARWRKRTEFGGDSTYAAGPHAAILAQIALGLEDFVHVEAGFGAKSDMCRSIADALGIGLESVAFLDDSPFERAEVSTNARTVRVLDQPVLTFPDTLLYGAGFVTWERTRRAASYRSRAAVVRATRSGDIEAFLHSLQITVEIRDVHPSELGRVSELLLRAHQLDLNGDRPTLNGRILVAYCRDRLADHGLVSAAVLQSGRMVAWVCSCRVLPHRVAATILHAMRSRAPGTVVEARPTLYNAVTFSVLEEGPASWVNVI